MIPSVLRAFAPQICTGARYHVCVTKPPVIQKTVKAWAKISFGLGGSVGAAFGFISGADYGIESVLMEKRDPETSKVELAAEALFMGSFWGFAGMAFGGFAGAVSLLGAPVVGPMLFTVWSQYPPDESAV